MATTEDDGVVIARDLGDRTLFDLCADLGLDIGTDLGPEFTELDDLAQRRHSWATRLSDALLRLRQAKRDVLSQPLKAFVTDGSREGPSRAAV